MSPNQGFLVLVSSLLIHATEEIFHYETISNTYEASENNFVFIFLTTYISASYLDFPDRNTSTAKSPLRHAYIFLVHKNARTSSEVNIIEDNYYLKQMLL